MTLVIEKYKSKDDNLIFANIQQNKYENSIELLVYRIESLNSSFAYPSFKNHYASIPNARKALTRIGQFERMI